MEQPAEYDPHETLWGAVDDLTKKAYTYTEIVEAIDDVYQSFRITADSGSTASSSAVESTDSADYEPRTEDPHETLQDAVEDLENKGFTPTEISIGMEDVVGSLPTDRAET